MKQISADAQLHEIMRILTSALFDNSGVQHIIDVAHDIIKNPIFMLRYADKTLNYSCDDNDLNSSKRLKMIINDIETNRQSLKGQLYDKYLFQSKIIDELSNSSLQYKRFHNDYLGCEQIICLIRVRRLDVGYLTIIESSKKISEIDESAIWRLSELIGQELQKKTLYSRNRNELKAQFVNHLLTAKNISEEYVYEDYLCAVDFIINSYTESHTDGIYKPEFKNEEASMEINLPVKIEDKDKLFVYSYMFGDSSRKTKEFIYDEGDNTIKVNFSSDEFTIAVYYDVSPYNGIYEEDVSERKNGYTVLVIIAVSVAIMIGLGAYAGKKRQ